MLVAGVLGDLFLSTGSAIVGNSGTLELEVGHLHRAPVVALQSEIEKSWTQELELDEMKNQQS